MKFDVHVWLYVVQFFLAWEMFQTKVIEKNAPFIFSNRPSPPHENRAVYEIMWKNMVEPGRPQMAIWHMHAGCLRLHTHTLRVCNNCFSTAALVTRTCLGVALYVRCMSCWKLQAIRILFGWSFLATKNESKSLSHELSWILLLDYKFSLSK
jgi:hypothetical protein